MTEQTADGVTNFLVAHGMRPEPAHFGQSSFRVGWRVRVNDLELVYRLDGDSLIICDFVAAEGTNGASDAVATFIRLIHRIERGNVPLRDVRGMLFETASNPSINELRRRLASVLEAQGAYWRKIDGDWWLHYPVAGSRQ
ncbi:secretion protein [Burkholderia humptydooensis]|uniref:Secretion protein n=1 Tax=Burkholderia humptydooensis TaxID=430531 RepID=A0A7U4P472_9BURK|nr:MULTISPECIES: secretion protein [Burkholderia]AJY42128.1 putative secretion system effector SseE [Burkholderia sp. 2002721687]ALX42645.1 secretion protein [Burkholderia humptydooensis]QPS42135.1 secretion protein [Burkholderia humptydooensis]